MPKLLKGNNYQLKIAITRARFFSGKISDRIPVANGLQPDSPAAIIIRNTTSCQYCSTVPIINKSIVNPVIQT